ncbi:GAF domain-containing protein [Amycolatopsis lurida]|uniref:Transcriptional regulator n=1 Tax=Amycolatopsis lurida NRRL 2430 TaxID=1460371 RepID=A0A2P2FXH4_AMYLU|nr:GAF and ANTAR domain-containing protein [Amycolatopsis lurida]KFU81438.1 transcriptional regulator [Amycolatopsis lurida NRRL 2430]SED90925.1 GAF domain-containing protein [Amycolatopsis lurida]
MTDLMAGLPETFVQLADTLVDDFDLVEFLDLFACRCVELLGVGTAGLLLADARGALTMVAASDEKTRPLELFQVRNSEGPGLDCYRRAEPVVCPDLARAGESWPKFSREAENAGFRSVYAVPMRLREDVIGALNLFDSRPASLDDDGLSLARALAGIATIGILHHRTWQRQEIVTGQLQTALNSRVLIEQAKGVLAERLRVSVDDAFGVLRAYARSNNRKILSVAAGIVDRTVDIPR